MKIKNFIKTSLISFIALGLINGSFTNTNINAKHRHYRIHRIYHHIHKSHKKHLRHYHKHWMYYKENKHNKKHHIIYLAKRSKTHKLHIGNYVYILNTATPDNQFLNNGTKYITNTPFDPQNTISTAESGTKVKIIGSKRINQKLFYAIESDTTAHNDLSDGWIYSGAVGITPNMHEHAINLQSLENNTTQVPNNMDNDTSSSALTHRETQARYQTIKNINNDRSSVGEDSLSESPELDQIAQLRSKQIINNYTHKDSNGLNYYYEDAQQLGDNDIEDHNLGENIGVVTSEVHYSPKHAANDLNKEMFDDEASTDGGHYYNITDQNFHNVGVGVTYLKNDNSYWISEDFGH